MNKIEYKILASWHGLFIERGAGEEKGPHVAASGRSSNSIRAVNAGLVSLIWFRVHLVFLPSIELRCEAYIVSVFKNSLIFCWFCNWSLLRGPIFSLMKHQQTLTSIFTESEWGSDSGLRAFDFSTFWKSSWRAKN